MRNDNLDKELDNQLGNELDNTENTFEEADTSLLDDDLLDGEGVKSLDEIRKQEEDKGKINKVLYVLILILFITFLVFSGLSYFFKLSLSDKKVEGFDQTYMNLLDEYVLKNISNDSVTLNVSNLNKDKVSKLKKFIDNKGIFFYKKQEIVNKYLKKETKKISTTLKDTESVKKTLVKYRFLPKELSGILKDIKITPILLTLNSIKLYVTDYVYLKTGKFDEYILSYVKKYNPAYSKLDIKLNGELSTLLKEDIYNLRELGVKTYLSDIVFNYMYVDPNKYAKTDKFANNYFINNFYNSYKKVIDRSYLKAKKINSQLKKKDFVGNYIMILADVYNRTNDLFNTLDAGSLPVDINLLSYDPEDQTLSFNVKISLKEGETKISVVKLATDIITLLRESRLIIGSNINFDNLKVSKLILRTPNGKKVYDTTNLIFKTSVQNSVNVEVTDVVIEK